MNGGSDFVAIGADELQSKPAVLTAGDRIRCARCGQIHELQHGTSKTSSGEVIESTMIQFYRCGESSFMAGFMGRIMEKDLAVIPKT